jgi:hypothetical protein
MPHHGNPTSTSFVSESKMGGFRHAPPCGADIKLSLFSTQIIRERRVKPTDEELIGGALAPV